MAKVVTFEKDDVLILRLDPEEAETYGPALGAIANQLQIHIVTLAPGNDWSDLGDLPDDELRAIGLQRIPGS